MATFALARSLARSWAPTAPAPPTASVGKLFRARSSSRVINQWQARARAPANFLRPPSLPAGQIESNEGAKRASGRAANKLRRQLEGQQAGTFIAPLAGAGPRLVCHFRPLPAPTSRRRPTLSVCGLLEEPPPPPPGNTSCRRRQIRPIARLIERRPRALQSFFSLFGSLGRLAARKCNGCALGAGKQKARRRRMAGRPAACMMKRCVGLDLIDSLPFARLQLAKRAQGRE